MSAILQTADGLVILPLSELSELIKQASLQAIELYEQRRLSAEADTKELTTAEAVAFLKLGSADAIQRAIQKGLPYIKGCPNKFRLRDLEKWKETHLKVHRTR